MEKPDIKKLQNAFKDIAENKDVWEVDYSLSLFRKKLKNIGIDIAEWFNFLDIYIDQKVREVLAEVERRDKAVRITLKSTEDNLNASLGENKKATDEKIDDINKEFTALKNRVGEIEKILANLKVDGGDGN